MVAHHLTIFYGRKCDDSVECLLESKWPAHVYHLDVGHLPNFILQFLVCDCLRQVTQDYCWWCRLVTLFY